MNTNEIPTLRGVQHFIEIIEELSKSYPTEMLMDVPTRRKFLFRGVSNTNHQLLPTVLRKVNTNCDGREIVNDRYTAWAKELDILKNFIAEASGIVQGIPTNDLHRWAEYAQHFGAPTRFLDWTSNPLAALYFACCNSSCENPAIWILNLGNYHRFGSKKQIEKDGTNQQLEKTWAELFCQLIQGESVRDYPIVYQPYYVDQRMSAQSSYFMVWGNKSMPLEQMLPKESQMILSNLDKNGGRSYGLKQEQGIILKLEIFHDRKQEIMRQLDLMGINEKTLFPGLDGIGKYIERKYRFDYNEAVEMM